MYLYQKTNRYFAQVADDIQDIAEDELKSLGADETHSVYRGMHFTADQKTLYRINYHSALINRVLAPIITFKCHSDKYLHQTVMQIRWQDFIRKGQSFAVFATVSHSHIKHSKFAALRLKDGIVDYFREHTGNRPDVDPRDPDVWLNLHIEHNIAVISLDASGGSLHKRGYRRESVNTPMAETLAAAIIRLSEWNGKTPLIDPFCGSGTLLCEAYLHATHMPPGLLRNRFGFERLPDFNVALWKQVKKEAEKNRRTLSRGLISGSDIAMKAASAAQINCKALDYKNTIEIKQLNVFDIRRIARSTIVCNPPYGIRVQSQKDMGEFYKQFGDFLKQKCTGCDAFIYFGDREYIKRIGLRPAWKKPLSNGGLDGRLVKYELY